MSAGYSVNALAPIDSHYAKFELECPLECPSGCPSECPSEKRDYSVGNPNIEYIQAQFEV